MRAPTSLTSFVSDPVDGLSSINLTYGVVFFNLFEVRPRCSSVANLLATRVFPFQGFSPESDPSRESDASSSTSRVGDAILASSSVLDDDIDPAGVRALNDGLGGTCKSLKETEYPKMMSTDK